MAEKIGLAYFGIILIQFLPIFEVEAILSCNNSLYVTKNNGRPRRTVIQDGDFMVQGIFSQTAGTNCETASKEGVINVVVMELAIEHIHESNILPGFQLGYQVDNGCTDIPKVMERGIEIVSMYRPNSVCRADFLDCKSNHSGKGVKPIHAVVGPGYSFLTIPLASLMGLYNIPQISYQASSRLLNKRDLYRSFFRTIPSDSNQVLVMLDIMERFDWNYLITIGSDDDYGKLGISALKESASSRNVCIAYDAYIPNSANKMRAKVIEIVEKLKETPKAKLVVLFTYSSMGEMILQEAEKYNLQRIWLTSDAWTTRGPILNVSENYLSGVITVATEKAIIPKLQTFLEHKIRNEPECNPWLALYLKQNYLCRFEKQTIFCPGETPGSMARKMLADYSGGYGNLYDAMFALSHGISAMLTSKCGYKTAGFNKAACEPFMPEELLEKISQVNFTGILNRVVNFDKNGDPKTPHYIIENIQKKYGRLQYIQIGTWDKMDGKGRLNLNTSSIHWPQLFTGIPGSKCSRDCLPGEYVHAKTECCWSCQQCDPLHISNSVNSASCTPCPSGHHTDSKKTICIKTPIVYLTADSGGGIAIITVSCFGIFIDLILVTVFFRLRNSMLVKQSQPAMVLFSTCLLLFSFLYGIMHILKPNDSFCSGRSSYFFMLFATFGAMLLSLTTTIRETVTANVNKFVTVDAYIVQYVVIVIVMLLELIAVIIWLEVDPVTVGLFPMPSSKEFFLECKLELTLSRMICMALPCFVLIVAMIIAFRERNQEHAYNEPKFLSFTTISLSIIVVAFIPTFKYVVGVYKAMVMAFTVDLCAYTYIACMFVPKVYALITQGYDLRNIQSAENDSPVDRSGHEIGMTDGAKSFQSASNDSNGSPKLQAKYICKDTTSQGGKLFEDEVHLSSYPPSPSSGTVGSPRKLSDTGSGSHLMSQKPTYV